MRPIEADGAASRAAAPVRPPRRAFSVDPRQLGSVVADQLDRLLPIYAPDAGTAGNLRNLFSLLTAEALDRPARPPFDGLSFINANGLPFQWVFNLSPCGNGLGFLCEVGRPGGSGATRLTQTLDRIERACSLAGGASPRFLREAAAILLPGVTEPWPAHWRSAAWVGVAARGRMTALKPYFNMNRGHCRERWLRAGWLLKALGRERALAKLCDLSAYCSPGSWPVGLAIDILPDGSAGRVKLYFRSEPTTLAWLARWHDAAGLAAAAPEIRRFLDLFGPMNQRTLPDGAIVVSLEVHADERLSLKTDLAVTKWTGDDGALFEAATALLSPADAAGKTLAASLRALGCEPGNSAASALLRFVGLGLEPDGASHLNLYLEPPLGCSSTAPRAVRRHRPTLSPQGAAWKGTAALLDALADDHWEDFALPVGASDAWVTGYILAMLADLPSDLREKLRPGLAPPLAWLLARQRPGGGWGYNGTVPDDADSTAWAIIALRAWGRPTPPGAVDFLLRCRQGEQFATYSQTESPKRAWAAPAPDVSAVVARALNQSSTAAFSAQNTLTPAYWWASPLYTTAMRLDCAEGPLPVPLRSLLARFSPAGTFERALLVRALVRADLPANTQAARLVQAQRRDGLWPPAARLRVPYDDPSPPWRRIDSGVLYTDSRGLFTSATAVAALGLLDAGMQRAAVTS